jgi:hypothetical protein
MYTIYKEILSDKLDKVTMVLSSLVQQQTTILDLPLLQNPKLTSIIRLITSGEIKYLNHISVDTTIDDSELIYNYLKSLFIITKKIKAYEKLSDKYKRLNITERQYNELYRLLNFKVSAEILNKSQYTIGNHLGIMEVVQKKRYTGDKYNCKVVDWNESLQRLLFLAQAISDDTNVIASDYTNKIIKKAEFISKMKPYVWSKETPDKPEWLMYYTDEDAVWWVWHKSTCTIPNKMLYSFVPTNYIHITDENNRRSQVSVSKSLTIEEIINSRLLGNRDKINCIFRKNPTYFKN